MVKDTRASIGKTVYTDSRGYYKAQLHLHNDNLGDPILVAVKDQEQRVTATFDPKDLKTERRAKVNFGSGCAIHEEASSWVYYSIGAGAAAVAAVVGVTLLRKRREPAKPRKGKRKH